MPLLTVELDLSVIGIGLCGLKCESVPPGPGSFTLTGGLTGRSIHGSPPIGIVTITLKQFDSNMNLLSTNDYNTDLTGQDGVTVPVSIVEAKVNDLVTCICIVGCCISGNVSFDKLKLKFN